MSMRMERGDGEEKGGRERGRVKKEERREGERKSDGCYFASAAAPSQLPGSPDPAYVDTIPIQQIKIKELKKLKFKILQNTFKGNFPYLAIPSIRYEDISIFVHCNTARHFESCFCTGSIDGTMSARTR